MAAFTAQIMIGQSHTYDGGMINLNHTMYLSENSVPRWILSQPNLFGKTPVEKTLSWIPHQSETILEDGLLLIGLHVIKDNTLLNKASQYSNDPIASSEWFNERTMNTEHLRELHAYCRSLFRGMKLVFTLMAGSSLFSKLEVLQHYPSMEVEVVVPIYSRSYNPWKRRFDESGRLGSCNVID